MIMTFLANSLKFTLTGVLTFSGEMSSIRHVGRNSRSQVFSWFGVVFICLNLPETQILMSHFNRILIIIVY